MLTEGLKSPYTPLRRFLARELSAGTWPLRATYRAQLPTTPLVLPREEIRSEAGTSGTAIDQRLRLSFTCAAPVDGATLNGIVKCGQIAAGARGGGRRKWAAVADVGLQLSQETTATARTLNLDERGEAMLRADEDEERLIRMLLGGAWYALLTRNPFAFPDTPLWQAATTKFTLDDLLAIPNRALVDDVLYQLRAAQDGLLDELRGWTTPGTCIGGPVFDGSKHIKADADLIADGILLDFKSTRNIHAFEQKTMHQLLGYTLLDYTDQHKIDAVGIYLTRAGALITWPIEEYLALLGARRRDLPALRAAFQQLCSQKTWHADDDPLPDQASDVDRVLRELAAVIPADCCRVCAQPLANPTLSAGRPRLYCSRFCSQRSHTLRRHGWLD